MSRPDRRLMRKKAREAGVLEETIDAVLARPDEQLEMLEVLTVGLSSLMVAFDGSPSQGIAFDELDNGAAVSTVVTSDLGPETAILNDGHAYPVERYATTEYAEAGHRDWVDRIKRRPKTIQPIGWCAFLGPPDEVEMTYTKETT